MVDRESGVLINKSSQQPFSAAPDDEGAHEQAKRGAEDEGGFSQSGLSALRGAELDIENTLPREAAIFPFAFEPHALKR